MMTKRLGLVCVSTLVITLGSFLPALAAGGNWDYNFNLYVGQNNMGTDWKPYSRYMEYGVETTWGKKDQPLLLATDVFYSTDSARDSQTGWELKSEMWQVNPGIRKVWVLKKFMPYMGFGVSYITTNFEYVKNQQLLIDSDHLWGFWAGGGFMFRAWSHVNVGLTARFEAAKQATLGGENRSGNSAHFGFLLGWGSATESAK